MPYRPARAKFTDANGRIITHLESVVDEPISPATESPGATVELHYTPRGLAGEVFGSGVAVGATRARIDISTDGGTNWAEAVDVAADVTDLLVRPVGLPFTGDDTEVAEHVFGVMAGPGEADWAGEA